jgi:hypothetical protein
MAIAGLRGSGSWDTNQRPRHFREGILMLYPNGKAPLTGLTTQMKTSPVDDPEFNWFEKKYASRRFVVDAATNYDGDAVVGGAAATLGLNTNSEANQVKAGDILMIEQTGELLMATGDGNASTGNIAVTRGWGQTVGVNLGNAYDWDADGVGINPYVVVVGSAYEEGADTPTAITYDPVKVSNYTQIFRRSLEHTRTAMKTRLRTGDQVKEARREALEHHGVDIEYAFFFGKAAEILTGAQPKRSTRGIVPFITEYAPDNVYSFGGDATMYELEGRLEHLFRQGSQEKMAFCGNGALLAIQQIIRKNTSWQFEGGTEFGMKVTRLFCPFGTVVFRTHPLFNVLGGGTTGGTAYASWANGAVILDMGNLVYRPLKDSDTKYLPNRQGNGIDGAKSEYLTECGLELHHAETHEVWKNLTRGVVDA